MVEVSATYHPERDEAVVFVRDISKRKQAEEALGNALRLRTELEKQAVHSQQMESLGRLAGGVAHDMNNVLGAILGLATSNLERLPEASPIHADFGIIAKAAVRGGQMVKSLLDFARQTPVQDLAVDLNGVIRDVAGLLERTTLARIRLEVELDPGLRPIRGDAGALTHSVMNLCINAVDAMPDEGTLALRTRNLDTREVEVEVRDTGSGMSPEVSRRAMDPFFTTKEVGKGTGLGLSMVYSAAKAHHGRIAIQSEPGRGTRVTLCFPACEGPVPAAGCAPEAPGPPAVPGLDVLLVDDDPLIQFSTRSLLDRLGHVTTSAASGEGALARMEEGYRPDAVILDLNMPGLGGSGTLPRLRAILPGVPVILATGKPDQTAHDLVDGYPEVTLLAKPFALDALRRQLGRLASRPGPGRGGPPAAQGA
jgi:CheY-like chemotaxis protein